MRILFTGHFADELLLVNLDWDEICRRFGPTIWSVAIRILRRHSDAVDCYQEVLLEAFQQSEFKKIRCWEAYLRWLTTRRAIDALRSRRSREQHRDSSEKVENAVSEPVSQPAEFDELVDLIREELAALPVQQSQAFWLVAVEQRSYEEVAEQMGVNRTHVGVLVHRARNHLQHRLQQLAPHRRT